MGTGTGKPSGEFAQIRGTLPSSFGLSKGAKPIPSQASYIVLEGVETVRATPRQGAPCGEETVQTTNTPYSKGVATKVEVV